MSHKLKRGMTVAATIAIVAGLGYYILISGLVISPSLEKHVEKSSQWCDAEEGELSNSQVIGSSGGLHCELPNGTTYHMSEVAENEYTHNLSQLKTHSEQSGNSLVQIVGLTGLIVLIALLLIRFDPHEKLDEVNK